MRKSKIPVWERMNKGVYRLLFKDKKGTFCIWIEQGCEKKMWYWRLFELSDRYSEQIGYSFSLKEAKEDSFNTYKDI